MYFSSSAPPLTKTSPSLHLHRVAGLTDDALDEVARRLIRKAEDDDVAAPRRPEDVVHGVLPDIVERQEVQKAEVDLEVDRLVHQYVLPVVQRALHARSLDAEVLHHRPHADEDQQRQDDRLYQVAGDAAQANAEAASSFRRASTPRRASTADRWSADANPSTRRTPATQPRPRSQAATAREAPAVLRPYGVAHPGRRDRERAEVSPRRRERGRDGHSAGSLWGSSGTGGKVLRRFFKHICDNDYSIPTSYLTIGAGMLLRQEAATRTTASYLAGFPRHQDYTP